MAPMLSNSDSVSVSKQESSDQHEHCKTPSGALSIEPENSESQDSRANEKDVVGSGLDGLAHSPVDPYNTSELGMARIQSRASSTCARPAVKVPRSELRGLLSRFTIVPEITNPYDYTRGTKWGITATIAVATAAAPLGSSIFYPALNTISKEFNTTSTITNLAVAMYMVAMSIFPIWWSALSEQFGRRTIYLVSFTLFVLFSVASALSVDISMLIVMRIGVGGASASVQAVGAGTIADIWEPRERGLAMSMFYLGPLLGPLFAPIIGGALSQAFGWKSTMWFLAIYGGVIVIMLTLLLPETLARDAPPPSDTAPLRRLSTRESAKLHSKKFINGVHRFVFAPLKVLLFLRFPPVLITVVLAAFAFGSLFVMNITVQQQFAKPPYSYSQLTVGLLYIPSGLGYIVGSLLGGRWLDYIMAREAVKANRYNDKGKLIYLPEDRLRENAWIAVTVYPCGLLLFGWTINYGVMWPAPAVGAFIFGITSMLVFSAATTMLTEFIRKRSSAGVAVNNFVRNLLSCIGTVVAAPWLSAVGPGWVFTATSLFCMVISYICVFLLQRNAPRWRKSMEKALAEIS
ncbi:MFS multidrug resistance transporter, putative [Cordyceps militaris CM01]|uniref:MFS multidrug resistance transporter, putative n=2 Tax=Cordyceps militaris TaxID=73501 RepID=G3JKG5_CORMM|nr:MFS multidrug resistance transporter, putative [Cordyceps militaris CM01]ATY58654.1 MFS multidrug resistance [Cordyceps militaris]EGX92243.1 MFS multidrug resistance transporter, putative [Cordyceps militaris CM01]